MESPKPFHATWVRQRPVNNCFENSSQQLKTKRTRNTQMNAEKKYEALSVFIGEIRGFRGVLYLDCLRYFLSGSDDMARIYNFNAGPSPMPLPVLEKAQSELLEMAGAGMSVMEMSHRSKEFQSIIDEAEAGIRRLLGVPEEYAVLFLQGGAKPSICNDSYESSAARQNRGLYRYRKLVDQSDQGGQNRRPDQCGLERQGK